MRSRTKTKGPRWFAEKCDSTRHTVCSTVQKAQFGKYVGVAKPLRHVDAHEWCRTNYGDNAGLAVITSYEDHNSVAKACEFAVKQTAPNGDAAPAQECWIGLNDMNQEFKKWNDRSGTAVSFSKWDTGYPKKATGVNCGLMAASSSKDSSAYSWRNGLCSEKRFFVCNINKKSRTSSMSGGSTKPSSPSTGSTGTSTGSSVTQMVKSQVASMLKKEGLNPEAAQQKKVQEEAKKMEQAANEKLEEARTQNLQKASPQGTVTGVTSQNGRIPPCTTESCRRRRRRRARRRRRRRRRRVRRQKRMKAILSKLGKMNKAVKDTAKKTVQAVKQKIVPKSTSSTTSSTSTQSKKPIGKGTQNKEELKAEAKPSTGSSKKPKSTKSTVNALVKKELAKKEEQAKAKKAEKKAVEKKAKELVKKVMDKSPMKKEAVKEKVAVLKAKKKLVETQMKLKQVKAKQKVMEKKREERREERKEERKEGLKPAKKVLQEVKRTLGKDALKDKLLTKMSDLKQQEKELDLKHKMIEMRKNQRQQLDQYTKYMTLRQLAWERQRERERQRRKSWRQRLLQREHQMKQREHYQLMNGLKGFMTAFKQMHAPKRRIVSSARIQPRRLLYDGYDGYDSYEDNDARDEDEDYVD